MANKPTARNWNDVQLILATTSMALSLGLWNLFAGPDREAAVTRAQQEAAQQEAAQPAIPASLVTPTPAISAPPTLQGNTPILLGGSAPQTRIVVQSGGKGGGGGGGRATSTRSS
jgi:hypothetical protein